MAGVWRRTLSDPWADLQRLHALLRLAQAGKLSDRTLEHLGGVDGIQAETERLRTKIGDTDP